MTAAGSAADASQIRRVVGASLVGTTIEWYDFLIYASAAVRYRGLSFAYAFGAILGGGFAPLVATWLIGLTGTSLWREALVIGVDA